MARCARCGNEIPAGSAFCAYCGIPVASGAALMAHLHTL
ncbi:zinc-ribbon domain-containing protein [Bifidobacterium bifidum]